MRIESTVAQLGITLQRHSTNELRVTGSPVGQLDKTLSLQSPAGNLSSIEASSTVFAAASRTLRPPALLRAESLQSAQASVPTSAVVANNGGLELIASPAPMRASIGPPGARLEYNTASVISSARTVMRDFIGHLDVQPYDTLGGGVRASLRTEMEERITALDTKVASASDLLSQKADEANSVAQLQQDFGAAAQSMDAELDALEERLQDTSAPEEGDPRPLEEHVHHRQRETELLRSDMDSVVARRLETYESQGSAFDAALLERVTSDAGEIDSPASRTFPAVAVEVARSRVGQLREQLETDAEQTRRVAAAAAQFENERRALENDVERTRSRVQPLLEEAAARSSIEFTRLRALRAQLDVEANATLPALEGALEAIESGALLALLVAFDVERPERLLEVLRTRDALPLAYIPSPLHGPLEKTRALAVRIAELRSSVVQTGIRQLAEREQLLREDADAQASAILRSLARARSSLDEHSQALERLRQTPLESPLQVAIEQRREALQALVSTADGLKQQLADSEALLHAMHKFEGVGDGERLAAVRNEQADAGQALQEFTTSAAREKSVLDDLLANCTSFNEATSGVADRLAPLENKLSAGRLNPLQIEDLLHRSDQLGADELPKCDALGTSLKSRLSERDSAKEEVDDRLFSLSARQQRIAERARSLKEERAALLEEFETAETQLTDLEDRIRCEQDAVGDENLDESRKANEICAAEAAAAFEKLDTLVERLFADSNDSEALAAREQLEARRATLQSLLDEWRADIESIERAAHEKHAAADEFARLAAELDSWLRASEERLGAIDSGDGDPLEPESVDAHIKQLEKLGTELESRARPLLEQLYQLHSDPQADEALAKQLADFEERLDNLSSTRSSKLNQFSDLKTTLQECLAELSALNELFEQSDTQLRQHLEDLDKSGLPQKALDSLVSALEV